MSGSTFTITANPVVSNSPSLALASKPTSRKKTVVAAEKKSNNEMVDEFGTPDAGYDNVGSGRDLSHSINSDMGLERLKDLLQKKTILSNSTISPRSGRKLISKSKKPRWRIVLGVFVTNFLPLFILLGLVHMIRNLSLKSGNGAIGQMGISEFEGRIAEVEGLLKTTTKMMQIQVEVVDRKIESEVGGLRRDLTKRVEEKSVVFDDKLKNLEVRTDRLDNCLDDLRATSFLTKEDFERFLDELKKSRNFEGIDRGWSLDDIRAFARDMVVKEIERHAADGLGKVDYAVASGGAMVVKHSEPYIVGKGGRLFPTLKARNGIHGDAQKMLQPSFGEPGQCFPLKGKTGFVEIRLRREIILEAITLEHVAKSVSYDRSSAPKDCRISAWFLGDDTDPSIQAEMFVLAEFTYDLEKSNAQTFNVESPGSAIVNMIRFDFTANHGSPTHTCIYRLRVHGHEPESVSTLAVQS